MKRIWLIVLAAIYVISAAGLAFAVINRIKEKYTPETAKEEFFISDQINLIFEDKHIIEFTPPVVIDDEILLPFDFIKKYLDNTVFYDKGRAKITITTPDKVIRMENENLEAFVNYDKFYLDASARYIEGILYMPVMVFSEIFQIDVTYLEEQEVIIIDKWKNYRHVGLIVSPDGVIRSGPSIKNTIYKEYSPLGNEVTVLETNALWTKVRSKEGIIGYVQTMHLHTRIENLKIEIEVTRKTDKPLDKVVLAWQYVHVVTPPAENMKEYQALNVLSPTWFTVIDADGTINNKADISYIRRAEELGYQVWPLINNTFSDIEMTSAFLNDTNARENVIRQLLAFAQLYGFTGINVDFENVYLRDKDVLTQFMRELTPLAHLQGLIVSVDVGVPDGSETYSRCYDHKALSDIADYVFVMTYDQHWSTSPVAGSQAQLSWVENRLKRTLQLVDNKKLVLGIPFYTRVWEIKDGNVKNILTVSIDRAKRIVETEQANVSWCEESGQYYAYYIKDGATYKMWIEDEKSIELKTDLVKKYDLAGVGIWELVLGNYEVFEAIDKSLNR